MKALIALLIVVVLLAAGLLVADRVGEQYAGSVIAKSLTSELRLSHEPTVKVQGFPFLTQWAAGEYQEIDIAIPSVTAASITVTDVVAQVENLHTKPFITSSADVRTATAGTVHLRGLVPFAALPLPSGYTASASGSQLKVSGTASVFGISVPVTAIETITLHGTTATFTPTDIQAHVGSAGIDVSGSVAKQLTATVNLTDLPFGVEVTGLSVAQDGLQVTALGTNVSLTNA